MVHQQRRATHGMDGHFMQTKRRPRLPDSICSGSQRRSADSITGSHACWAEQTLRRTLDLKFQTTLANRVTNLLDADIVRARANDDAAAIVAVTSAPDSPPPFLEDLKIATREAIEEEAGGVLLDQVAPSGENSEAEMEECSDSKLANAVVEKLSARWLPTFLRRSVDWAAYGQSVYQDTQRFSVALSANPTTYAAYLKAPMTQAGAAYLRTCYATPQAIFP